MIVAQKRKGEFTFIYHDYADAREVYVVGDFNQWQPDRKMRRYQDGTFRLKVSLPPGRYEYKFIVNGQWCEDPDTDDSLMNPFGTRNSVCLV